MSAGSPKVAVVMSVYNGEDYVSEQIESLLAQDVAGLAIFVRDDGSPHEASRDVLRSYERAGKITLFCEKNVGVTASFLDVMSRVPCDYDYVALCDQDDVWYPHKIARAVELLSQGDPTVPRAYCAEYRWCDGEMNPGDRSRLMRVGCGFQLELFDNVAQGNTMVMSRALVDRVCAVGPSGVYYHDWWIALVACALGELVHDDYVCLDYRRTGSNVSPTGTGALRILASRIRRYVQGDELRLVTGQLERLRQAFGSELRPEDAALLERFLDGGRVRKMMTPGRLRQSLGAEVALRALFLLGML